MKRKTANTLNNKRLDPNSQKQQELELTRAIAAAFLSAQHPLELYRNALAQITPLVGASFASVFTRDSAEQDLLKLVCAHNWPQASARYLGHIRIRVGRGPTGRAVELGDSVEVTDVFADPTLREWWEPARELGFVALISLPLESAHRTTGALTFYYESAHEFSEAERHVLSLVATQLSAMAERAEITQNLRAGNEQLRTENAQLHAQVAEAEEARRLKTEFLANMSHELRTPLNSILGYTFLLQHQSAPLSAEQHSALNKIDASANALLGLINDLLELTQVKLQRASVSMAPEDAVLLAKRAAELANPMPEAVTFRLLAMPDRIPIKTDGDKVVKILDNLLSNAIKFTREGEISLTVRQTGPRNERRVEWTVKDSGIGIAPDQQEAIFDEFRQVVGSSTRLYGGTGLGLALSLGLARLLGGEITVESEQGIGSTFVLRLPLT
ncbi:MAG TPA: ATP-binding protein [Longimicrobiales bacterium]|nr:ATP-binding protein [Longimicrobiales bacterium]